ncbi:MAG TPA: nicotinate-nucleotide adenylyltransferase [Gemmatimonadales bacterium]|nr:nicotinate-nucleotide adenylyltransferase [Gemmatimonadales bacterium]
MRVGLFGGSFDPIHHGHLITARSALEQLELDELRFVPAREQPFKVGRHQAPAVHRVRMVELAIAGAPGFRLEAAELDRPGPSFTVDTLRALSAAEPGTEWVLLLGDDAARDLAKWREPEQVVQLARIAVFARPGTHSQVTDGVWRRITVPLVEISATDVRRRVREGHSIRYWVPDAVAAYVAANGLYKGDGA